MTIATGDDRSAKANLAAKKHPLRFNLRENLVERELRSRFIVNDDVQQLFDVVRFSHSASNVFVRWRDERRCSRQLTTSSVADEE